MSFDFGPGVSRSLSPQDRAFTAVVWQRSKPPLDAEMTLISQIEWENRRQQIATSMPSGFFLDPTRAEFDYQFNQLWVSQFRLGVPRTATGVHDSIETQPVIWANVNGWVIPVAGTDIDTATGVHNVVKLYPPPERDLRVDFVFLEAWATIVEPNPSADHKPTVSTVWKYGNVKFGGTNVVDDLEDPSIGLETTKRVQVQYRIRVYGDGVGQGSGVNLASHPDGLDDPNILGQGAATSPVAGLQWANMREALGDPSLWRAGDGDPNNALETIDGYTYAIPICAVFRRNSGTYVSIKTSGNPNQNGAFLRQPGAKLMPDPLDGDVVLTQALLGQNLSPDDGKLVDYDVTITNLNVSGLGDTALVLSSTFLVIGEEIVGISAVDLNTGKITIPAGGRGRWGTAAVGHASGTAIQFFNTRPDGLFADEIASQDVLDLRRAVNMGDWDYGRLLSHNVAALAKGTLRTAWKRCNVGDTCGPVVHEIADLYAGGVTHPAHTDSADGPDGIRTIWSDAATIQPDVTLLLDHEATTAEGTVGFTNACFDATVDWDVGADLKPCGFMNKGPTGPAGWYNGSSIHLFIGGSTGEDGARGTFRAAGVRDVRFVTPNEYWKTGYPVVDYNNGNQHPVTMRYIGERTYQAPPPNLPAVEIPKHGGPQYPWRENRFEKPFLVLGGLLHSTLRLTGLPVTALGTQIDPLTGNTQYTIDLSSLGLNFNTAGVFFPLTGVTVDDPTAVSVPFLRGQSTLFGMLTNHGRDRSGASSEVYLLTWGDAAGINNNGAFRVIGAGQAGYTEVGALAGAGKLVVEPLSADFTTWDAATGNTLTVDFRSQYHNADDISNYGVASRQADLVLVINDIAGETLQDTPWDIATADSLALPVVDGRHAACSKALISLTLMYHPGRSAPTRVPDAFVRFAMQGGTEETIGTYLRRSPSSIDTTFSAVGTATDETYWDSVHVQTWNRLSALGWHAPVAPAYGGAVVGFTEVDREHELFVDRGSKTVLFRPFRNRDMTLKALTWTEFDVGQCLLGAYVYPDTTAKDGLQILTGADATSGKQMGFMVPQEFMPRFGRQDIPYRILNSGTVPTSGGFMPGINHLFTDVTDLTNPVFNVIGGEANTGGTSVKSLFFVAGDPTVPYAHFDSAYGPKGIGVYGARKTTDIDPTTGQAARDIIAALKAINSSDLGRGLKGIQLPPHVGIARLYGVYEYADYIAKGGTAYKSNRYEMEANPAVNLLREDADQQTLYILQDGAEDFTEHADDHTYIIPSNALDLTRIPTYVFGTSVFEDFDYVVEATVFFFAEGFINKNNIVLCRKRSGTYALNTDGDDAELENVKMCLPCPAGVNDHFYVAYNRTVYQGDPYMTRDGNSRQDADYANRYGRLHPNQAWLLRTAVQQYDSAGAFMPQALNPRGFEVLAAMDFYTTLGTGKVGGTLLPGTSLDVGYLDGSLLGGLPATRMPLVQNDHDWRFVPRAFTEGQKGNTSRASATLEILSNESLLNANVTLGDAFLLDLALLDSTHVQLYAATTTFRDNVLIPGGVASEDVFIVDDLANTHTIVYFQTGIDFGTLYARRDATTAWVAFTPVAAAHPEIANLPTTATPPVAVSVMPPAIPYGNSYGAVAFDALYDYTTGCIVVRASWMSSVLPFDLLDTADDPTDLRTVREFDLTFGAVAANGTVTQAVTWTGVATATVLSMAVTALGLEAGLVPTAEVTGPNQVTITVHNHTTGIINAVEHTFRVAMLLNVNALAQAVPLPDVDLVFHLTWETGSKYATADNLVSCINANSKLQRTVTAFNEGSSKTTIEAVPVGAEGNSIQLALGRVSFGAGVPGTAPLPLDQTLRLQVPSSNALLVGHQTTMTYLVGGVDLHVNAGNGTSQMALTGMTERLPLGVLVQDSDFLCENPLGDTASAMISATAPLRPVQTLLPLTTDGEEYSRFMGAPGELVAEADGQIAPYSFAAWTEANPTGTKKFRLYRGGGSVFLLSGDNPGGPIDWVSESFPVTLQPVVKGGILVCRALLVRNFYEEALQAEGMPVNSQGDEIQMVVLTQAFLGTGLATEDIVLDGIISPTGYGEGYAAADRYRCMGRPMVRGYSREIPNPVNVTLAVYPENQRGI